MDIPAFETKEELFAFVKENENRIMASKKAIVKRCDGIAVDLPTVTIKEMATQESTDMVQVKAVINTTNILDSHGDVHIDGLWTKSLQENKNILHLQEHEMEFEKVISDGLDLKAYAKIYQWRELGFDFDGTTQALIFESKVKAERNEYMLKAYRNGWVKNHSVGMRYVKYYLCYDSENPAYTQEKDNWDRYFPLIANKEDAINRGMFFAVTEAKVIEGSAVVIGSNQATPTLEVKDEPLQNTQTEIEPPQSTQKDVSKLIQSINFKF